MGAATIRASRNSPPGAHPPPPCRQGYNQTVPTILREGPYQFYFVSADGVEPPHIHVRRDNGFAKFWLNPVELQTSGNLRRPEIRRIHRIVEQNQSLFLEEWNDYFNR